MDYSRLKRAMGLLFFFLMIGAIFSSKKSIIDEADQPDLSIATASEGMECGDESGKIAYLTFDDGPSKNTAKVLDILKEYNVTASFFLIGSEATPEYKEVINRMINEGHSVGLHCMIHDYSKLYGYNGNCYESILEEKRYLSQTFGIETSIYRLPGGSCNKRICNKNELLEKLRKDGLYGFDWNVCAEDSLGNPDASTIARNVIMQLDSKEIVLVLMHDGVINDATIKALPWILKELKREGYQFRSLENAPEMLFKW